MIRLTDNLLLPDNFPKKNQRQLWIGKKSVKDTNSINICKLPYLRAPSNYHQKYDIVWNVETNLSYEKNWMTILDEMLRFIGGDGFLVIKYNYDFFNYECNCMSIKNFLGRNLSIDAEIEWETPKVDPIHRFKKDVTFTSIIKIKRHNLNIYQNKGWSFAITTLGNKVNNVVDFCRSIRKHDKIEEHEIIVVGPKNKLYDDFNVKYLQIKYRDDYGEICKKKNDIARFASNQNILIAHDRFILNDDFFVGMDEFGYDFDYIGIKQFFDDNKTTVPTSETIPTLRNLIIKENKIHNFANNSSLDFDNTYIGGGLMIFKKDTMEKVKFNNLIFWNQAEDVEMGKSFLDKGFPARLNQFSSAKTFIPAPFIPASEKKVNNSFVKKIIKKLKKK